MVSQRFTHTQRAFARGRKLAAALTVAALCASAILLSSPHSAVADPSEPAPSGETTEQGTDAPESTVYIDPETTGDAPTIDPEQDPESNIPGTPEALSLSDTAPLPALLNSTLPAPKISISKNGLWPWPGVVYTGNFADPTVIPVNENGATVYYAFSTNSGFRKLPIMKSIDGVTWNVTMYSSNPNWATDKWPADYDPYLDQSIPAEIRNFNYLIPNTTPLAQKKEMWLNADGLVSPRPTWARAISRNLGAPADLGWQQQETWAPSVAYFNGKYHAYMAVRANGAPDRFCIGLATSANPSGPYRYISGNSAVVCPGDLVNGVIDPEPFYYQGKWFLLWKTENSPGKHQGLFAREIDTKTGRLKSGAHTTTLLLRDLSAHTWEKHAIENPSMATINGTTYLFYSGGEFWGDAYTTAYAICPNGPTAPCTRPSGDNRLLGSYGKVRSPGGGSVVKMANGSWKLAYHASGLTDDPEARTLRFANIYSWPGKRLSISDGKRARFVDVPNFRQFAGNIMWLAEKGITTGDSTGSFNPSDNVSRAAMAAFLYRYAGSPKYTPKGASPFADVTPQTQFYKEIRWMYSRGLTTGSKNPNGGKPLFQPGSSITREAMAAFFYRMSGVKGYTPQGRQPLADITPKSRFYREIRWMYDSGVTTGITSGGKTRFNARGTTKRDAFAAFLQRYDTTFGKQ